MKQNETTDLNHTDSINESKIHKISHTRRWIEFSIVMAVVAILAIIVIPTISTILKSADYSKAYDRSTTIIKAFEIANADAVQQAFTIPDTNVILTSNALENNINTDDTATYQAFITKQMAAYLTKMTDKDFTYKLIITPDIIALYYWDKANHATISNEAGYCEPDYVYYVQHQNTKMLHYDDFLNLNILPENLQ